MAYGLKPVSGPDVPSSPMTSVPGAGGALDTDVPPVGAIGAGRFGGVHAASRHTMSRAPTHAAARRERPNPPPRTTPTTLRINHPHEDHPGSPGPRPGPAADSPVASGRVRHEEKITVYVTSEELIALDRMPGWLT